MQVTQAIKPVGDSFIGWLKKESFQKFRILSQGDDNGTNTSKMGW